MYNSVRRAVMVDDVTDNRFTTRVAALVWAALWAAATSFVRARAPMNTAGGTEGTVTRTTSASALSTAGRVLRGAGSGCSRHRRGPSQRCVGDHRLLGTGARLAVFAFAFAFALVPATSAPVLNGDIATAVVREFFRVTNWGVLHPTTKCTSSAPFVLGEPRANTLFLSDPSSVPSTAPFLFRTFTHRGPS